jgi:hypothetical protein
MLNDFHLKHYRESKGSTELQGSSPTMLQTYMAWAPVDVALILNRAGQPEEAEWCAGKIEWEPGRSHQSEA